MTQEPRRLPSLLARKITLWAIAIFVPTLGLVLVGSDLLFPHIHYPVWADVLLALIGLGALAVAWKYRKG